MNKQQEALKLALEALEETLRTLDDENAKPGGAISDTIWYSEHETLFDYIAAQITAIRNALADSALERMAENAREIGLDYGPIVERVEDSIGMGNGAWDMVEPKELARAFHEALAEQPAQQQKEGFASPGGGYVPAIPRPMPLDWKLVPRKATPEMLKAMDECAQEGYDERLYAGMASSVYMAAWDASPVMGTLPEQPAQQQEPVAVYVGETWCGSVVRLYEDLPLETPLYTSPPASKPLTDEDLRKLADKHLFYQSEGYEVSGVFTLARAIEAKLREKNA